MDLEAEIKWIHKELETVKDPTFIEAIKNMLKYRKKVNLERISIDQYNAEIATSISQIDSGNTSTHEEIGERIKQWGNQ